MPVDDLAASIASHQWQGNDNESLSSCYLVSISTTKPVKGLSGLYITKPIHGSSTSMVCPMLTKSEQMSAWHFFNYQQIFLYDIVRGKLLMHLQQCHYCDVKTSAMASRITGVPIVCSTVCSGADQRKHQSSAWLAFVRGIQLWPVDSPHNGPVTRKMFSFDDVIMLTRGHMLRVVPSSKRVYDSSCNLCHRSGMGVTKTPFVNFSVSKIFVLAKVPLRLFESHLYLTGATAAQLRRHLSNINEIFNR